MFGGMYPDQPPASIGLIGDVDLSTPPTDGQHFVFNGTSGMWEAQTSGDVSTSVTLTDNRLVRGNGGSDIDVGNIFMSADGNDLTVPGDLIVNGTTVTLNTETLLVEDKNIEMGVVGTPTDVTADGGGITLKGATDKTIIWDNANDNWSFNQSVNLLTGLDYKINNVSVLNATTLGSPIVNSSLQTLATIGTGVWQGTSVKEGFGGTAQTTYATGDILFASAANTLSKLGIGSTNQVLSVTAGVPAYRNAPVVFGDIVGPATAVTNNALMRWDTTTGKLAQNSVSTLDDLGNLIVTGISTQGAGSGITPVDFQASNPTNGIIAQLFNATTSGNGAFQSYGINAVGSWTAGMSATNTFQILQGTTERLRIDPTTGNLDMNGSARIGGKLGVGAAVDSTVTINALEGIKSYGEIVDHHPSNTTRIRDATHLSSLATGDVITISSDTKFIIKTDITDNVRFSINTGVTFTLEFEDTGSYTYSGTGDLFSGQGGLLVRNGLLISGSTGKLLGTTAIGLVTIIEFNRVRIVAFDMGEANRANIEFTDCQIFDHKGSLFINKYISFTWSGGAIARFTPTVNAPLFDFFESSINQSQISVSHMKGSLPTTEPILKINPGISEGSSINIIGIEANGKLFFDTPNATGVFSAVANKTLTNISITSVTTSAGIARFNHAATDVFVGQIVVLAGFTGVTAYNDNTDGVVVTAAGGMGGTFFEAAVILFQGNDTSGNFSSDSVEMTETSTAATTFGNFKTTDAADYDRNSNVYHVLTNTFRVNMPFTETRAGTYTRDPLTQTDPKILVAHSSKFKASEYNGMFTLQGNTTVTTIVTQNVWEDLDLNDSSIASSTIERYRLIDEDLGTIEFRGKEDRTDTYGGNFSILSPGSQRYQLRLLKKVPGGSFVVLPEDQEIPFSTDSSTGTFPLDIPASQSLGDQFKLQVRNIDGTDNITITDLSCGPTS